MKRPTSVTVVSVLLIVFGGLGVLGGVNSIRMRDDPQFGPLMKEMMDNNPLPEAVQLTMPFVGAVLLVVCGAAALNGKNWSRWLYVGWTAFSILLGLVFSPSQALLMVPSLIVFAIFAFFSIPAEVERFLQARADSGCIGYLAFCVMWWRDSLSTPPG